MSADHRAAIRFARRVVKAKKNADGMNLSSAYLEMREKTRDAARTHRLHDR